MNEYINVVGKIAKKHGGRCLSETCPTTKSKVLMECRFGHTWIASFGNIKYKDQWCRKCISVSSRKTIKDAAILAAKHNGLCLSKKYENNHTKMEWRCSKGHTWYATLNKISIGRWCPHCSKKAKLSIGIARHAAEIKNGKCLSDEYLNLRSKLKWECSNGHMWAATLDNIKNHGTWCPTCSVGKTQCKLSRILRDIIGEEPVTIRPNWLKNPSTGYNLEIDIYFPKHKIAVEYNGEQHYYPVDFAGRGKKWAEKSLRSLQKRDKIKRDLIQQNTEGVKHFVIFSYADTIEKEYVRDILIGMGVI